MNQKLLETCKENIRQKEKWEDHLERAKDYLREEQAKIIQLKNQLRKEQLDVERLEGLSFSNLFYTITGQKLEKMEKEEQEAAAAQLKYEEAKETAADLEREIEEIKQKLTNLGDPIKKYEQLMHEKEKQLHSSNSKLTVEIDELSEEEANKKLILNELKEAISAGNQASSALSIAISSLNSAKGWSTWDLFGGGMVSTAIKHSKINDAKSDIHHAQRKLRHFEEEMKDVQKFASYSIHIGDMLTFADYFFDGFIVDWMVHGKINDSLKQTEKMKYKVDEAIDSLIEFQTEIQIEKEQIKQQRIRLIEEA
ncbi:hypothetical protein RYX45_07715 [Alkalihalophilus pseudofirmus]|uniref:Uncharacterized protein n=1 Tax=Alkalihalophilus pseudofirmus TaxID=79885 RepID=A0AAJ2NL73_ALKPS|nr:hypothetical protein [Alkalihalophilus pseudofirmus]MDV2885064.1 hypothetical protein [Alkalihalophilus pseudofirmus]